MYYMYKEERLGTSGCVVVQHANRLEIRSGIIFLRINTNCVPIKGSQGQRRICQTHYARLGCP